MMVVEVLQRTSIACPSQWEGETDDGRPVNIRYRYGNLSVNVGEPGAGDALLGGECVFAASIGGNYDGMIEYNDVRTILGLAQVMDLPQYPDDIDPSYEEMGKTMIEACKGLEGMLEEGTVKVLDRNPEPGDTVVTQDVEAMEALIRSQVKVINEPEELDPDGPISEISS
jgi:hypothetical protein